MIEFTRSFKDSNGVCYATLAEAQHAELVILIEGGTVDDDVAGLLLKEKTKVVDILTTTTNSRPKARATNGGTKRRAPAKPVTEVAPVASAGQA